MQNQHDTAATINTLEAEKQQLHERCAALEQMLADLHALKTEYQTDVVRFVHNENALRIQHELAIALSATNDLNNSLHLVLQTLLQLDAIDCGGIYVQDATHRGFVLATHQGLSPHFVSSCACIAADSFQAALIRKGTPVYQIYQSIGSVPDERREEGLQALAVIPIPHDDTIIACLNVASHTHQDIPQQTRMTLEAIALQIGSTIARITAETAWRESQCNFQHLFDCLQDLVFVLSPDGIIKYVNPSVEQTLGYTLTELFGMHVLALHPPDRREDAAEVFAALRAQTTDICTIPLQTCDGIGIPVETRVTVGHWDGEPVLFGIARDMTRWIRVEEALRQTQDQLEERVQERTQQLFKTIEDLHCEIGERQHVEDALRRSEDRYREIIDLISDSVYSVRYHTDGTSELEWGFNGVERLTGYTIDEIALHNWLTIVHPDDQHLVEQRIARLLAGQADESAYRVIAKDGTIRWFQDRARSVCNDNGQVVRISGAISDITKRKQAETALQSNVQFLETLLDTIPSPVFAKDLQGRYIACNVRFAGEVFGLEKAAILSRTMFDLPQAITRANAQLYHERDLQLIHTPGDQSYETQVRYADGTMHNAVLFKSAFYEGNGNIAGIVGVIHDITDYTRTKAALIQAHTFQQAIFDSLPDSIAILDESGTIVMVNQAWRGFGQANSPLQDDVAEGVNYYQICQNATGEGSNEAKRVAAAIRSLLVGSEESFTMEYPCHSPEKQRWFVCRATAFMTGNRQYVIIAHQDITQRKKIEETLRQSEERLRLVMDATNDGMWDWHLPSGDVYYSPRWQTMLGYEANELAKHVSTWESLLHPDDQPLALERVNAYIQGDRPTFETEFRLHRKEGGWQWILARGKIVEYDEQGHPIRMIGTHTDITRLKEAEAQLYESQAHLAKAQQMARIGSFRYDLNDAKVFFSSHLCTMTGYGNVPLRMSADEAWQTVHPHDRALLAQALTTVIESRGKTALDIRAIKADGTVMTFHEELEAILDEQDQVVEIFAAAQDITERTYMEQALRQSEARHRTLLSALPDLVFRIDQDGTFVDFKGSRTEDLFLAPQVFLGKHYHEVLPLALSEQLQCAIGKARQSGGVERFEYQLSAATGQITDYEARVIVGEDKHVFCVVRDISIYKQAKARVQQYAARTEALSRIATCLNAQIDLQNILATVCTETIHALHLDMSLISLYDAERDAMVYAHSSGIPAESIADIQPVPYHLIDPTEVVRVFTDVTDDQAAHANASHMKVLNIKSFIRVLVRRESAIIGVILGLVRGSPRSFSRDEQLLFVGIADQAAQAIANARLFAQVQQERALLSRRVAERTADLSRLNANLAYAVRAKDEFLANMSHELRTPLNAILGMSEALQEEVYGTLNARQQQSLGMIERSGRHLLSLINDILDLSKIEAGKIELEIATVSIDTICQVSLQFVKQQALKKRISVSFQCNFDREPASTEAIHLAQNDQDPLLQRTIQADERRLKQILVNLLSNAVKFTPEGGQVGLTVHFEADPRIVHFQVWDTGIGIAPEDQQKLFQPFIQVDSSLSRQHEGTGLGLALVMRLSELHGGSVTLESDIGKGSCFTVSLPQFKMEQMLPQSALTPPVRTDTLSPWPRRVLIIEDSLDCIARMTRHLHDMGIDQIWSSDADQAPKLAYQHEPDIILLDLLLTDASGWYILETLKSNAATAAIPVLIISVSDEKARGLASGAAGYLVKPVTRQQLHQAISAILAGQTYGYASSPQPERPPEPDALTESPLILLAEDNETNIMTVTDFLHTQGYQLVVARNGLEAVMFADEQHPDLILMDIQMPRIDGLEAIRRIRNNNHLVHVPIIALTALAMKGDRERCLAAGASAYLSKPVRLRELTQLITTLLRDSVANQAAAL
ncbi:MAG: PAS domain S-box protein [Chloroflexaceae bacterium]|nr:PAS domain S-box protein [Chloroflexaceae bacterium]